MCVALRPLISILRCAVLPCALEHSSARLIAVQGLRQFGRLPALAEIDTHRPLSTLVLCTDAPEFGCSLLVSRGTSDELDALLCSARYHGGLLPSDTSKVRSFVGSRPWRVVLSYHINELEACAILIALRWYTNHRDGGRRVIILGDSAVALDVLATGRSSVSPMMRYARHICAVLLERGLDLALIHVPTEVNPADTPSRSLFRAGHVVWPPQVRSR